MRHATRGGVFDVLDGAQLIEGLAQHGARHLVAVQNKGRVDLCAEEEHSPTPCHLCMRCEARVHLRSDNTQHQRTTLSDN